MLRNCSSASTRTRTRTRTRISSSIVVIMTTMHSFRTTSLFVFLAVTLITVAQLISGHELETGPGVQTSCSPCSRSSKVGNDQPSFTVKNFLPTGDANVHMVCTCQSRCGKLTVQQPVDIKECGSVEVRADFCGPVPKSDVHTIPDVDAFRTQQILCEFVYTRLNLEKFWRTQVLVWSREGPKKTFYGLQDNGLYFLASNAATGVSEWALMGAWTLNKYLSAEDPLRGDNNKAFETFGNDHCRSSSLSSSSASH